MDKTEYEKLLNEEQRHFYRCRGCGEMADKRQPDDVLLHKDHKQQPDIPYGGWNFSHPSRFDKATAPSTSLK